MQTFAERTLGLLGDANNLLRTRTVFGFHAKFLPETLEQEALQMLSNGRNSEARGLLGLKRRGKEYRNHLKFCPECITEQHGRCGYTWWQVTQQLPTAYRCLNHQCPLHQSLIPQQRGVLLDYRLPEFRVMQRKVERSVNRERLDSRLMRISEWGNHLWGAEGVRLNSETLRWAYLLQAKRRNWVAFDGSLRMQSMRDAFIGHYGDVLGQFDEGFLGDLNDCNGGFLSLLLRRYPGRRHPLKHVLLMGFLFEDFPDFLATFRRTEKQLQEGGVECLLAELRAEQADLIGRVTMKRESVSKAAATVGVSITVASRFLDRKTDFVRPRRRRIVGTGKETELQAMLIEGLAWKKIGVALSLRTNFIKDYLAKHCDIKKKWAMAFKRHELEKHRQQFLDALAEHPDWPLKAIRRLPNNGFQWLYNNDREWLRESLPALWKR